MVDDHVQSLVSTSTQRAAILVIDDDRFVADAMAYALESQGYRVRICLEAQEALEVLRAGDLPDLILLDLVMPRMNGWEFRIAQKREPTWADVPLIVTSCDASAQAVAIDADAYLQKPVSREQLLSCVQATLEEAERQRAVRRNAELERLSSLGLLAAGIAHEINNPLAFAIGNLELAKRHIRELQSELEGLQQARVIALGKLLHQAGSGAQRVADVVRSVAAFSRPETDSQVQIDVIAVLESSIQLVNNELRHHARLERSYEPVPTVLGNPAKLGQVFVNLLSNAIQAVSGAGGTDHVIELRTGTGSRGEAVVTVSDTGPGIPAGAIARIFDPFFSTKPIGRGTGLGLAISRRLVAELRGEISARNRERGAAFTVSLPAMSEAPQAPKVPAVVPESRSLTQRAARVLVIDDEQMMCEMLAATLADHHDVEFHCDAREALARFEQGESFDVILCDLMMPDVSGMDVHAELSRSRPEQASRMVFMTGGTFTARARGFLDALTVGHLEKPFRPPEVLDIVERVLAQRGLTARSQRLN